MPQVLELGGEVVDADYPWVNSDGELLSCDDEKINKLLTAADYIRLCALVVKEHQYAKFKSALDGPNRPKYFLLDAVTAGMVLRQWQRMGFRLRRKLLVLINKTGPIRVTHLFWKTAQ